MSFGDLVVNAVISFNFREDYIILKLICQLAKVQNTNKFFIDLFMCQCPLFLTTFLTQGLLMSSRNSQQLVPKNEVKVLNYLSTQAVYLILLSMDIVRSNQFYVACILCKNVGKSLKHPRLV